MQDDIERRRAAIKLANQTDLSNASQVIVVGGGVDQIDMETFSKTVSKLTFGACEAEVQEDSNCRHPMLSMLHQRMGVRE